MSTVLPDPIYPIVIIDKDDPLTSVDLQNSLTAPGVTLLVRSTTGNPKRGGYYFQIEVSGPQYVLHPFDQKNENDVHVVNFNMLLKLINHMSGRQFDKEALLYVRHELDMRIDG